MTSARNLFARGFDASRYAQFRPNYPRAAIDRIVPHLPTHKPASSSLAVDAACGTGQLTAQLLERQWCTRVAAFDVSPEQVAQLERALGSQLAASAVADATALPVEAGSVTLLTLAQALHWIEPEPLLAEAARVLEPGGLFAIFGYSILSLETEDATAILHDYHFNTLGKFWHPSRKLLDDQYKHFSFESNENFEEVDSAIVVDEREMEFESFMGYLATSSAHKSLRDSGTDDPLPELAQKIKACDVVNDENQIKVSIPFIVRIGKRK